MKKRRILSLVTAACLAFSLTSCGSTSDDAAADSGDASEDGGTAVITLGMIGPLTGSLAVYGTHNQRGVELAIEEINAAGQTIVMVTHSVKAASHAGRVLFLRDGKVYHQLYRGEEKPEEQFRRISDTLTVLAQGGEDHA